MDRRRIFNREVVTPVVVFLLSAFISSAVNMTDGTPINQDIIENYCTFIENASFYYSTDYTITMIISEEMPAYFEGQKSLDEVIGVINSRVGTMVAERN